MPLRLLIGAGTIRGRVRQLGRALCRELAAPHERPPLILALLDGSFCFVADLVRAVPLPDLEVGFLRAGSYGAGTTSSGTVTLGALPPCAGRRVVLVDDILDTGRTLRAAVAAVRAAGASQVRSCVLLDKPTRRVDGPLRADWTAFTIPDVFVVGYGLDHAGRFRHLPDIRVLEEDRA